MLARFSLCALLLVCASQAWAQADRALVEKLRSGGYVLYLRHTSTDFSQNDSRMKSYEDCASQRNLTDKGREEARAIGAHLKRLSVPVGAVLASPFCRTMETARLVFGKAEPTREVLGGPSRPDDPGRYDLLRKLLATRPPSGQNVAISSHGNPFYAVFGPPYLAEGEIAVVEPRAASGFALVGRIAVGDWDALE